MQVVTEEVKREADSLVDVAQAREDLDSCEGSLHGHLVGLF